MGFEAILTGFGLSGSAGLNAYLPLLIVGIMHRMGLLELAEPYDVISSIPVLIVLGVLLLIEMTVDKIPAVDHLNDVIQTVVRPVAGSIAFAASTSTIQSIDPTVLTIASILAGSVSAGSTHSVKATARPAVNVTTAGTGTPIISVIEDVISLTVSIIAVLLPFIVIFFALSVVTLAGWLVWDMHRIRTYFRGDLQSPQARYEI
jgi:hypothetical protein